MAQLVERDAQRVRQTDGVIDGALDDIAYRSEWINQGGFFIPFSRMNEGEAR